MSLVEGYTIPFYEISQQKNIPNSPKLRQEEDSSTEGNSRDVKQGSHCRDPKLLGSGIYQQLFSRREKGWGQPTSNKLETPKSFHTLPALQDGGFALSSKHSKEGRLHVQTGFEACILFSSIKSGIHKICAVSLLGKLYEFLCLCFGLGPAPKILQNYSKFQFQCCVAWTY